MPINTLILYIQQLTIMVLIFSVSYSLFNFVGNALMKNFSTEKPKTPTHDNSPEKKNDNPNLISEKYQ